MNNKKPISILICALGGEGGGVLTQWVVDAARLGGFPVQATSVPGVAQRTGATTYYIEIYPEPILGHAQHEIVFGLNPLPGQLDLLISSELLEAARQVSNGLSSKAKTMVISSTGRVLTTAEKMHLGDGRVDAKQLISLIEQFSLSNYFVDMASMTQQANTVISSVMLGCMASSGLLPMKVENYSQAIGEQSPSQKASLKGFNLGLQAIHDQKQQLNYLHSILSDQSPNVVLKTDGQRNENSISKDELSGFSQTLHPLLMEAIKRIKKFQNQSYADLFLSRIKEICFAEQSVQQGSIRITEEAIKRLTLLMCFDDLIQVAQLKISSTRFERVSQEVKKGEHDLVKIYDHFKPGLEELAAVLPQTLANPLLKWSVNRQSKGLPPLSVPIKLASHTIHGALLLKFLVSFKALRSMSSRYRVEQALIDHWVREVVKGTKRHLDLGLEVAKCAGLIKGYGSTHSRSRENFNHIMQHVLQNTRFETPQEVAQAVSMARVSALKDEAGKGFDLTMKSLGIQERSPRYQPIRWMSKSEMIKRRLN